MSKWFQANQLYCMQKKTNIVKFIPSKFSCYPLKLIYAGQILTEAGNIKFLVMQLDNHHTYRTHIDLLLHKLSTVCFVKKETIPCIKHWYHMIYYIFVNCNWVDTWWQ